MSTLPGVYDAIVTKQNISDPAIKWRNTWTFKSVNTPAQGDPFFTDLLLLEGGLIWPDSELVELSVYNWARGRQPYPLGQPIFTTTLASPGYADTGWTHLQHPRTPTSGIVCLRLDHNPISGGKPGRTFSRAILGAGDVTAISGGRFTLVPTVPNVDADWQAVIGHAAFAQYFSPGAGGYELVIVRYTRKTDTVHGFTGVLSIRVIGATTNKLSRKGRR